MNALEDTIEDLEKAVDGLFQQQKNSSYYSGTGIKLDLDGKPVPNKYGEDGDEELVSESEMQTLNEDISEYEKIKSVGKTQISFTESVGFMQ